MHAASVRREHVLRALGVTPWRRRVVDPVPASTASVVDADDRVNCVVILPGDATEPELDLIGKALRAYGALTARAARLVVGPAGLGPVPAAATYLVFGDAQARALGHVLPAAVMRAALIVLVDAPDVVRAEPAAKRRLWNGLRALGRAVRER